MHIVVEMWCHGEEMTANATETQSWWDYGQQQRLTQHHRHKTSKVGCGKMDEYIQVLFISLWFGASVARSFSYSSDSYFHFDSSPFYYYGYKNYPAGPKMAVKRLFNCQFPTREIKLKKSYLTKLVEKRGEKEAGGNKGTSQFHEI